MEDDKSSVLSYTSEKFIDNENISAHYYSEIKTIHFIWKQRSLGNDYRQPFLDAGEFAENHDAIYFLTDIRNQGIVGPDDRKWFEDVALPLAIERGLQKSAVVFEGNIFKLYYINMLLKHFAKKSIPMKFFKSLDEAKEWLLA